MPTNKWFNAYSGESKQAKVYKDLIDECVKFFGIDVIYIPRTSESHLDLLFGDDPTKSFTGGYPMAMYIQNTEGFEGPNDLFTKFGLVINKDLRLLVGNTEFQTQTNGTLGPRPREGDILWFPNFQALFEIKFTNADKFFYAFGSKPFYGFELSAEEFRYNNETITTGIDEIDVKVNENVFQWPMILSRGAGTYKVGETISQATTNATAVVVSWNLPTTTLVVKDVIGVFAPGVANVVGESSAASWGLTSIDMGDNVSEDLQNNVLVRTEANTDLDLSESNPFGNPFTGSSQ